ncbi:unnamed protein product [Oikopleura dioica]|uniref:Uncharacterized protein n=1 Tax=Oikopleura dioica TaxID=34765 RepID=E4XU72_OIKDI|nr:unnamed protein product [Oikopleura dioica]CBY42158.1 unnamed protein product [Oikopleura dioica]
MVVKFDKNDIQKIAPCLKLIFEALEHDCWFQKSDFKSLVLIRKHECTSLNVNSIQRGESDFCRRLRGAGKVHQETEIAGFSCRSVRFRSIKLTMLQPSAFLAKCNHN